VVPMRYDHSFNGYGLKYHCLLSVYAEDGTVSVTVGGIEMGQGLNTKVLSLFITNINDQKLIVLKLKQNLIALRSNSNCS
jgi:xanthine dehydrogenase/oxidase